MLLSIVYDDLKQVKFLLVSNFPYILTQEHFCQRLLFISPAKIEIYAKQLLYPLKFTHKNGGHFQNKGHFYRNASKEQNVNILLLITSNRSVNCNVLKIIYICLFVYNVYFLCRHMKFKLVRHFVCLKTKMTELRVGCFHIRFFSETDERDMLQLKVLIIVQVVNDYITNLK